MIEEASLVEGEHWDLHSSFLFVSDVLYASLRSPWQAWCFLCEETPASPDRLSTEMAGSSGAGSDHRMKKQTESPFGMWNNDNACCTKPSQVAEANSPGNPGIRGLMPSIVSKHDVEANVAER